MTTNETRDQQTDRPEPQALDLQDLPARPAVSGDQVKGGYCEYPGCTIINGRTSHSHGRRRWY